MLAGEDDRPRPIGADRRIRSAVHLDGQVARRWLAEDGNTLVLVSAHERWVFLREVDVARRRVRRVAWLRAPQSLLARVVVAAAGVTRGAVVRPFRVRER